MGKTVHENAKIQTMRKRSCKDGDLGRKKLNKRGGKL